MSADIPLDDSLKRILTLLNSPSPNIKNLSQMIHIHNKSLGATFESIRRELYAMEETKRKQPLINFIKTIHHLKCN